MYVEFDSLERSKVDERNEDEREKKRDAYNKDATVEVRF